MIFKGTKAEVAGAIKRVQEADGWASRVAIATYLTAGKYAVKQTLEVMKEGGDVLEQIRDGRHYYKLVQPEIW